MTHLADLDEWARRLAAACERSAAERANETELREDLDPLIREAASELSGLSEREITAERSPGRRGSRLRYDKAYGGLVIEWEWKMTAARRARGAQQGLDYLAAMRDDLGLDGAFTAVVCDGREWGFLASDPPTAQLSLFEPLEAELRFQWRRNSPAACRRFLALLGSNRQRPVTADGLANAFGPNSLTTRRLVALLVEQLAARRRSDRADTLFREWRRSVEVVYGNLDDEQDALALRIHALFNLGPRRSLGELLFAVHTYFSLVVRLVAVEVLGIAAADEEAQPTLWSALDDGELIGKLRAIDDRTIPRGLEIQNMFEADVFSWFVDALEGNVDLLDGIRATLDTLQEFALPRVAYGATRGTDVLRDLYRVLVPRELRKALGEFATPTWLAQACLERLAEIGATIESGRMLDPTCGTGTFLLPILQARLGKLRAEHGEQVSAAHVRDVLNSVVGFDINPIAVTAARVNYVLALGDLAAIGPLTLSVWRADSILLPDEAPPQTSLDHPRLVGHPWQALRTSLPEPFPIPPPLATAERMAQLRVVLEDSLHERDADASRERFLAELDRVFGPVLDEAEWEGVREVAAELQDRIRELRDSERNGVWASIIENNFAPLFAGRFDVVVGNPPWLTWTKTPSSWRRAGEVIWKRYGLWRVPTKPGQSSTSLASGDIAILVFALAVHRYAKKGGFVGLLVPRSLVNADPGGRAFRRFRLKTDVVDQQEVAAPVDLPFRVLAMDDWSEVKPFAPDAANSPIFLAARTEETHVYPVPTTRWQRAEPGARFSTEWPETRLVLRGVEGASNPVDRGLPTSAWSFQPSDSPQLLAGGANRWTFGKGLDTRGANGVYFVRILDTDLPRRRILVENVPGMGRNPAVRAHRGWIEPELVHPLLRGRDVRAWHARPSGHVVAPYDPASMGSLLADDAFRASYPRAWHWLRRHADVLKARKPPPTRSWDLAGRDWCRLDGPLSHMGFGNIVVVREQQARPAAAVVPTRFDDDLGRTAIALIDHKLVFCTVDSPDEAVYLAAVINSTPIQDLLASFSNAIAVSPQTLERLPIPDFDLSRHQPVVEAGREAIAMAERGEDVDQEAVDSAVLDALGLERYVGQPRSARRRRATPEPAEARALPRLV